MTIFRLKELICSIERTVVGINPPELGEISSDKQGYHPGLLFSFLFRMSHYQDGQEFLGQEFIDILTANKHMFIRIGHFSNDFLANWKNTCKPGQCYRTKGLQDVDELYFSLVDKVNELREARGYPPRSPLNMEFCAVEMLGKMWQPIAAKLHITDERCFPEDIQFSDNISPWGFLVDQ